LKAGAINQGTTRASGFQATIKSQNGHYDELEIQLKLGERSQMQASNCKV